MTPTELKGRREALHLTQQQMAEAIRVRQHHLSRWETGAVPITPIRAAWLDRELKRLERLAPVEQAT